MTSLDQGAGTVSSSKSDRACGTGLPTDRRAGRERSRRPCLTPWRTPDRDIRTNRQSAARNGRRAGTRVEPDTPRPCAQRSRRPASEGCRMRANRPPASADGSTFHPVEGGGVASSTHSRGHGDTGRHCGHAANRRSIRPTPDDEQGPVGPVRPTAPLLVRRVTAPVAVETALALARSDVTELERSRHPPVPAVRAALRSITGSTHHAQRDCQNWKPGVNISHG